MIGKGRENESETSRQQSKEVRKVARDIKLNPPSLQDLPQEEKKEVNLDVVSQYVYVKLRKLSHLPGKER